MADGDALERMMEEIAGLREEWPAVMMIGRQARFGPEEMAAIRKSLLKPLPEPPLSGWERRQRNKHLRKLYLG